MLIAVAGAQGAGKSTVMANLPSQYNKVERKTSRSILADWNVTLDQVNTNYELTKRFQDEMLKRKMDDEAQHCNKSDVWVTERTFMDLATYTNFTLAMHNEHNDFVNEYYEKCVKSCKIYDIIFYLRSGWFNVVADNVRGINEHYSRMVDLVLEDATREAAKLNNTKLVIVDEREVCDRVATIVYEIQAFKPAYK